MSEILKLENIYYSVKNGKVVKPILEDINFSLNKNDIVGITGESGSGKTTLAKIIAGIISSTQGQIIFTGNYQNKKNKHSKKAFKVFRPNPVQILFQNNGEILNPLREIDKILMEAVKIAHNGKKLHQQMEEIFRSVNFPEHLWKRKGYELSGGEQQRAALARILAVNPELLILDEPFSAQDPESQLNLLNLFLALNKKYNVSMICIAHNLRILLKMCNKIIILYKGRIIEQGNTDEIFNSPNHPYTKYLLKSENYDLSYEQLNFYNFL